MTLGFTRAAVGSTNPAKVAAVRDALATLAPGCAIAPLDVPSDIAFGLEGGVELDGDRVWLLSWVAAIDPAGREGYASGLRMLLPPSLGPGLRDGSELGTLVDALFGVHDSKTASGAIGLLTGGAVSRTDAFADLVAMSLAPWIHPDHYR
jgi:non-canonical (house-cleaning) NTP pyrophosphatase